MTEKEERHEEKSREDAPVGKEPPPELICDLTKVDETESVKAADPRKRGGEE